MNEKNISGYAEFAQWEVELARGKAKGLVGRHGFSQEDLPDLHQELLLHIHLKRNSTAGWTKVTASAKTVTSRILDNKVRDIIDAAKRDRRKIHALSDSLSHAIGSEQEEETITYEDILAEDDVFNRTGALGSGQSGELRLSLALALEEMTVFQRRICALILRGFNVSETAKALGMKRTTLNHEIERMRQIFYRKGLQGYR